ncbi:MAG: hypothetical protein LLG06_02775 [Desulfobacteraceae bacterium]|nr:hypothetical protein [Desulfobacteraceae bacterium]
MSKTEATPDSRRVTIWLPEELIARADRLAERAEIDRGRLLRNIIELGIDTLEKSEKVGLLQCSLILRDMGEYLQEWVRRIRERKV